MKKEPINKLFSQLKDACYDYEGIECWSARDLQEILGYSKWSNFQNVINKSKEACINTSEKIDNHFADVGKMVELGSGTQKTITSDRRCKKNLTTFKK